MARLFTIGYEGCTAEEFFSPLLAHKVKEVIDVRLKPNGGGFASKKNLPYLLSGLGKIGYRHVPECAPTPELFGKMKREEITWTKFKAEYRKLLAGRDVASLMTRGDLVGSCLLCYEADAKYCHRRVLAEFLDKHLGPFEVIHL